MIWKLGSMALAVFIFSAFTSSNPISGSSSYNCSSLSTTYVTVTPTVTSLFSSGALTTLPSSQSTLQSSASISPLPPSPPLDCQQNNCLRQFMNPTNTQVTPFCTTYTTTINTVTTSLPDYVSMCDSNPSDISSACSCILTPSTTSTTSSTPAPETLDCQQNNCLRQFMNPTNTQVTPFCATYTTTINTVTTGLPDYVSMCDANPSDISSACSCVVTPTAPAAPTTTLDCQQNNCLRQFMNPTNTQVTPYCQTYTTSTNLGTVFPTFVSMCDADPSQVSSACSCVAAPTLSSHVAKFATSYESEDPATADDFFENGEGFFDSLSSMSSSDGSDVCPSSTIVVQTTTMTIMVTATSSQLPTSSSSTSSILAG